MSKKSFFNYERIGKAALALLMGLGITLPTSAFELDANGFINVFDLNADLTKGAGPAFGFNNPTSTMATVTGTTVVLKPWRDVCDLGTAADKDTYWGCDGSAPNKNYGKKFLETSVYNTSQTNVAQTGSFKACIGGGTLDSDSAYSVVGFVRIFKADFSEMWFEQVATGPCFEIPYTIDGTATVQLQKGFTMSGPNALSTYDKTTTVYLNATALPASGAGSRDPNAIPVLPLGALLGLVGLLGLFAARRLKA